MAFLKNRSGVRATMGIIFGMVFILGGCSQKMSPTESVIEPPTNKTLFKMLSLGNNPNALKKAVLMETTEYVTYKNGGELILEYKGEEHPEDNNGNIYVKTTFKVFSQTISEDSWLKLTMDTGLLSGDVDVAFAPHGVTFSSNALLNIEVKNADLSGIDENSNIGIFYVNEDTGEWERMNVYDIIIKKDEGYIKIIDAEIPHFSRYAVGAE